MRWRPAAAIVFSMAVGLAACSAPQRPTLGPLREDEDSAAADDMATNGGAADDADGLASGFVALGEPGVGGRVTSLLFASGEASRLIAGGDMLGISVAPEPLRSWGSSTGLLSWEVAEITESPAESSVLWAATMGGPYRSDDGGLSWEPSRSGLPAVDPESYSAPIEVVRFDPNDAQRLLAFGGSQRRWQNNFTAGFGRYGTVWESTNGGDSWTELSVISSGLNLHDGLFSSDGSVVLAATFGRGVMRSDDGGRSWAESNDGLPHGEVVDLAAHPEDPEVFWAALPAAVVGDAAIAGGVFKSEDGGISWLRLSEGLLQRSSTEVAELPGYERIVVAPLDGDRLYTSNVGQGQVGVYRSDDGGESWQLIADGDTDRPVAFQSSPRAREIAVHPDDPDVMAFSQDDYILGTFDGGESFVDLTTSGSGDDGFTGRGFSGLVANDVAFNPAREGAMALAAFDAGNFIGSLDGGVSWQRPISAPEVNYGGAEEIVFASADVVYVLLGQPTANFRGVGVSTDGGLSFTIRSGADAGLPAARTTVDPTGLTVDPTDPLRVLAVIEGQVYDSSDGAQTFDIVADAIGGAFDAQFSSDGSTIYVSGANGVYVADSNWGQISLISGSPRAATRLTVPTVGDAVLYAVQYDVDDGGLHVFNGTGWNTLLDSAQLHDVAVSPQDPSLLVAVSDDRPTRDVSLAQGVLISQDGGQTWTTANDGLPMTRVAAVAIDPFDPDRLVVGTTGRGFYEASIASLLGD